MMQSFPHIRGFAAEFFDYRHADGGNGNRDSGNNNALFNFECGLS